MNVDIYLQTWYDYSRTIKLIGDEDSMNTIADKIWKAVYNENPTCGSRYECLDCDHGGSASRIQKTLEENGVEIESFAEKIKIDGSPVFSIRNGKLMRTQAHGLGGYTSVHVMIPSLLKEIHTHYGSDTDTSVHLTEDEIMKIVMEGPDALMKTESWAQVHLLKDRCPKCLNNLSLAVSLTAPHRVKL